MEIDLASEDLRPFVLDGNERQARDVADLELDQYIDVTARTEIVAEDGAKE